MEMSTPLWVAIGGVALFLLPNMAASRGLISERLAIVTDLVAVLTFVSAAVIGRQFWAAVMIAAISGGVAWYSWHTWKEEE